MASESLASFRTFASTVVLICSTVVACSGTDDGSDGNNEAEPPFPTFNGDCNTVQKVPTFADLQKGILPICLGCHSVQKTGAARNFAPDGINFENYEILKAEADNAVLLVKNLLMPPPKGDGPTESQRNQLYAWAACGTPQ